MADVRMAEAIGLGLALAAQACTRRRKSLLWVAVGRYGSLWVAGPRLAGDLEIHCLVIRRTARSSQRTIRPFTK